MKKDLVRIKISETFGYHLTDTINRARSDEETLRPEIVAEMADNNELGLPPEFYTAYLRAAGAFDRDFFDRANGYQVLSAKNPPAVRRLRDCGLSLDFKAWMNSAFSHFASVADGIIWAELQRAYTKTGAKGKPALVRFRCTFKEVPRVSYALEIDRAALAAYLNENENEIKAFCRCFIQATPTFSADAGTWKPPQGRSLLAFIEHKQRQAGHTYSAERLEDSMHRALYELRDFYSADNSPLEEAYLDSPVSYSAEMARLEKQGRDYLALMGDKYAKDVAAGIDRNRKELIEEMLEDVANVITARNNPGLVWEV